VASADSRGMAAAVVLAVGPQSGSDHRRKVRQIWLVGLLAAAAWFAQVVPMLAAKPSLYCCMPPNYLVVPRANTPIVGQLDALTVGDGHLYQALALQPTLDGPVLVARPAEEAFRSQRMLMPWLMWASSLGRQALVPASQLVWMLLGVAAAAFALAQMAVRRGITPMVGLAVALLPGVEVSSHFFGPDTVALGAVTLGVNAWEQRRWRTSALLLCAAVLARESSVLVPLALMISTVVPTVRIGGQQWRTVFKRAAQPSAISPATSLLALAIWQTVLFVRFGNLALNGGFADNRGRLWDQFVRGIENWDGYSWRYFITIVVLLGSALLFSRERWIVVLAGLTIIASSSFGYAVWATPDGFPRPLLPATCFALLVVTRPRWIRSGTPVHVGTTHSESVGKGL
jgi:hypothetical protein